MVFSINYRLIFPTMYLQIRSNNVMQKLHKNKFIKINDQNKKVLIKQPTFEELMPLYYVLLNNLSRLRKK
jgi:aromatic ring-opening dioxygenase catalytic subunit (LigB family)